MYREKEKQFVPSLISPFLCGALSICEGERSDVGVKKQLDLFVFRLAIKQKNCKLKPIYSLFQRELYLLSRLCSSNEGLTLFLKNTYNIHIKHVSFFPSVSSVMHKSNWNKWVLYPLLNIVYLQLGTKSSRIRKANRRGAGRTQSEELGR